LKRTSRVVGEADAGAGEIVDAGGGTIAVWLIAAIVAAVAAGLTVWLVHRSSKQNENEEEIEPDQGKVRIVETIEQTDTEDQTTGKAEQRRRWSIVVIVVMAIALVGLIAWMTLAMRPNSPTAAPPEVVELMGEYNAAWNAYDADALEALVTPQYRVHSEGEVVDSDMENVRSYLFGWMEGVNWEVTNEGRYYAVETGTGTWFVSSEGGTVNRSGMDNPQMGVWRIRTGPDGTLLVADHYFVGG
jgi:flagellar basal body-associated protein FliL